MDGVTKHNSSQSRTSVSPYVSLSVDNFETSQCDPEQLIERNFYDIMKINDVARSLKCDYF